MSCVVFKQGVKNLKGFCLRIKIPNGSYWILRIGLMGRCQKVPKLGFQSQFSMSRIIQIFLFFFIAEYQFKNIFFVFDNINFKSIWFLKWFPIFDTSPLTRFSKSNNFLWVCWFLGKNLSNFVPPIWKLHNRYCHTL